MAAISCTSCSTLRTLVERFDRLQETSLQPARVVELAGGLNSGPLRSDFCKGAFGLGFDVSSLFKALSNTYSTYVTYHNLGAFRYFLPQFYYSGKPPNGLLTRMKRVTGSLLNFVNCF